MTDNLVPMTSYDWNTDQEVLDVIAEILAKLPALQAKGAIDSYIATDRQIHINMTKPKTTSWVKQRFSNKEG